MKTIFASLLISLLAISSVNAQPVINDPNVQVRQVPEFSRISVGGSFDVYITQSDNYALAVSAKTADEASKIKTEVRNGTLYIKFDGNSWMKGGSALKAYVSVKTLQRIDASGACDVTTKGIIGGDDLEIFISGATDFTGAVGVKNLRVDASGASDFRLQGQAENCRLSASGSSDIKAYTLITDFCEVDISGASDIQVTVNKELKVKGSGASDINYKGAATIREANLSGASNIKKRD